MTATSPPPALLTPGDVEHLNLLVIFHRIVGGLTCLTACIPFFHVAIGSFILASGKANGPEVFLLIAFVIFPLIFIAAGWALGICLFIAANHLQRRTRRQFCFVTAACACAFMPFGTALGIFTIIVLSRPTVRGAFTS